MWNLDKNKRKTFIETYQAYEEARNENRSWCYHLAECLQSRAKKFMIH